MKRNYWLPVPFPMCDRWWHGLHLPVCACHECFPSTARIDHGIVLDVQVP